MTAMPYWLRLTALPVGLRDARLVAVPRDALRFGALGRHRVLSRTGVARLHRARRRGSRSPSLGLLCFLHPAIQFGLSVVLDLICAGFFLVVGFNRGDLDLVDEVGRPLAGQALVRGERPAYDVVVFLLQLAHVVCLRDATAPVTQLRYSTFMPTEESVWIV